MKEKKWIWFTLFFTFLDQAVKVIVRNFLSYQKKISIIPSFFSLQYVENRGGAFSILEEVPFLFLFFSIAVILFFSYYASKNKLSNIEQLSISLLLGGAIGNFLDRVLYQKVTDYLSFTFGTYQFPIFNIADVCIVFGVCLWIFIEGRKKDGMDCNRKDEI